MSSDLRSISALVTVPYALVHSFYYSSSVLIGRVVVYSEKH